VVEELGGRAVLRVENYGESELARRYGVTRYPAIFVDDVLVATPKDFGFYGGREGGGEGRYAPIRDARSQERFRADLRRSIELVAAGREDAARALAPAAAEGDEMELPPLPADLAFVGLDGKPTTRADLAGKVVVVEHWATWCPPCRGTLAELARLAAAHPGRLAAVAVAVESDLADVTALAGEVGGAVSWTMETPELRAAFGAVTAVPTLRVYGADGRAAAAFFGAPPDLHRQLEERLAALLAASDPAAGPPPPAGS
jgi:thiol-disulfide isomerase/thioredoxin